MALFKVIKEENGYKIVDNLELNNLNQYEIAFTKGYLAAREGKSAKEVEDLMTHDNPEYDKGLLNGWAQYHVDSEPRKSLYDARKLLKDACFAYSLDKSESNFKAVIEAYHKLKDDDSDEHLTVTEEGEDLKLAYKYGKEELAKVKELLEKNKNLKISSYDETTGDVTVEDVEDSKVEKLSDSCYLVYKNNKLKSLISK